MSEKKYKHKEGEKIYFDLDGKVKGFGIIRGASTDEIQGLGRCWIVELEPPIQIDPKIYPFSCINIFECQFKEPPKDDNSDKA